MIAQPKYLAEMMTRLWLGVPVTVTTELRRYVLQKGVFPRTGSFDRGQPAASYMLTGQVSRLLEKVRNAFDTYTRTLGKCRLAAATTLDQRQ